MTLPQDRAIARQPAHPRFALPVMSADQPRQLARASGRVSLRRDDPYRPHPVRLRRRPRRRADAPPGPRPRTDPSLGREPSRRCRRHRIRIRRRLQLQRLPRPRLRSTPRRRCSRGCSHGQGVGATASRLIAGNHPEHERLEGTLAEAFRRGARAHLLDRVRGERRHHPGAGRPRRRRLLRRAESCVAHRRMSA